MIEVNTTTPPRQRPKLDPRLTTLLELGVEIVAPGEMERFESNPKAAGDDLLRHGPLAFLRGPLLRKDQLEVAIPRGAGSAGATRRRVVPPSIPVFIRARTPESLDRLAAAGIKLITRARTIATADVVLSQIAMLEGDDSVLAIEWSGAFQPLGNDPLEHARQAPCAAIGIDPTRLGALDGRGCVVGVVDVEGIDLYHPCFVDQRGRTRLYSIWDQRANTARSPFAGDVEVGPGGLGVVHRRAAIDLEISTTQLLRGSIVDHQPIKGSHGTRTAAMAVGLGDDRPDARGAAPGASLVFVNTFGSGPGTLGAMTELADAVGFVMNEADKLGVPCVVNVSLGDCLGPRDGTSPVEQLIDELLETDGRAIVVAAGNAHGHERHAAAPLGRDEDAQLRLHVAPGNTERAVIEIWYDSANGTTLALEIEAPDPVGRSGTIEPDGIPRAFDAGETRVLAISVAHRPWLAIGNRTNAVIRVEIAAVTEGGQLLAGTWRLHLRAQGPGTTAHAWIDHRYVRWESPSDTLTLTTPATARKALVVGAYDPRTDSSACFSGRGVDRGGTRRPDLLAPGVSLVSAWAACHVRYVDTASGTSFAAPLVAGVAALLFQRTEEKLSTDRLREEIMALTRSTPAGERRLWAADLSPRPPTLATTPHSMSQAASASTSTRDSQERPARPVRPRDAAQIIQGHYLVRFRGEQVARVLVMSGNKPNTTTEHWALRPGFPHPGEERPDVALQLEYLGRPTSAQSFLAELDGSTRHVRADCETLSIAAGRARMRRGLDPSIVEGISHDTRSNRTMGTKNYMRPVDRTQIIQGLYRLHQGEILVGQLLVIDGDPGVSTEHWLLNAEYRWPSEANRNQEIRFEYTGAAIELEEFLTNVPVGTTYVIASCQQQTLS